MSMANNRNSSADFANLSQRKVLVTGASSGIGKAIALECARAGADVIVHCSKPKSAADAVVAEIQSMGRKSALLTADFSQAETLQAFVDQAWQTWGRIDVWVSNAGADVLTGDAASWGYEKKLQHLWDVDVRAGMVTTKAAGQRLLDQGGGAILTIGWDQADRGMEGASGELFAATKNAIMGFSRSLALSLAPRVRVNCIAPGWIKTAWGETASDAWQQRVLQETPLERWGTAEDIASVARFLCSDAAGFVTGQVVNVNGGAVR